MWRSSCSSICYDLDQDKLFLFVYLFIFANVRLSKPFIDHSAALHTIPKFITLIVLQAAGSISVLHRLTCTAETQGRHA